MWASWFRISSGPTTRIQYEAKPWGLAANFIIWSIPPFGLIRLLQMLLHKRRMRGKGKCPKCKYAILEWQGRCPECGVPVGGRAAS